MTEMFNVESYNFPKLLFNKTDGSKKVSTILLEELNNCDEFLFSVAFLTNSGYLIFHETLKRLESKNIKGKIIVSQYQNFTQPSALRKLLQFPNIELRMIAEETFVMHTKGYIFKHGNKYTTIVGSSNLTQDALSTNQEWNIKLNDNADSQYISQIKEQFEFLFNNADIVDENYINKYEIKYNKAKKTIIETDIDVQTPVDTYTTSTNISSFKPNKMQEEALKSLETIRELGADKALVISSTGTGKTILTALDVKSFKPKKFLFVIHREQIIKDAMRAFKFILGNNIDIKEFGGGHLEKGKFTFAMVQTLSKDDKLNMFEPNEFDYIVFDEVHRIGAEGHQKIFNYFKPKFALGITATPERNDGFDVFGLFDHNIAYEIRLEDAMREQLICPFHYFGITDLTINDISINDRTEFNKLISEQRVDYVIQKIKEYGYSGNRVKGLVFVSRQEEAIKLSELFNLRGYKTIALTGSNSQEERETAIERLEKDYGDDILDYIFTVDIFNEGVDIPCVNQIVMLRPTQSIIVFVQQLGRGLRKFKNKEYVVVLDFIGNYENNFLIPIALSGNKEFNKDYLRKFIQNGKNEVFGASSISFDQITEKHIYESIDKANFGNAKLLKDSYIELKNRIGTIPTIFDFKKNNSIDIMKYILKENSYHNWLVKNEKEYKIKFNDIENNFINFVSKKYMCGKRPHELEFIKLLMTDKNDILNKFKNLMQTKYPNIKYDKNTEQCVINQMDMSYLCGSEIATFKNIKFIYKDNNIITISNEFKSALQNSEFVNMINDIIKFALEKNTIRYSCRYKDTSLKLYEKYTYDDAFRALNWNYNQVALNVGGYKYDKDTNTFPVFINYEKAEGITESINYHDKFVSQNMLRAISKNKRTLESEDIKLLKNAESNNITIPLFVRKNKDDEESKEFYFLGFMQPTGQFEETLNANRQSLVEIMYQLDKPVKHDIYNYIVGD